MFRTHLLHFNGCLVSWSKVRLVQHGDGQVYRLFSKISNQSITFKEAAFFVVVKFDLALPYSMMLQLDVFLFTVRHNRTC
jgi:hypothetical protein